MATPEELEKQLEALKQQNAELQKNVENYKANAGGDEALKKRLEDLEKANASATEENKRIKITMAKAEALKKYPFASPFLDKIVSDTPEDIEAKAKDFHEATAASRDAAIKEKEAELAARWGQLPQGSPPGMLRKEEIQAEYDEAKKKNNVLGMLKAKWIDHLQKTAAQ